MFWETEVPRECGIRSTLSFFFKKLHEEMHEGESHKNSQMMSVFFKNFPSILLKDASFVGKKHFMGSYCYHYKKTKFIKKSIEEVIWHNEDKKQSEDKIEQYDNEEYNEEIPICK